MSENANNIPLDDEDILDLTVVAAPGKPNAAARAEGPPEPGDIADFGADLDALLDSLGADGSVNAPAPQAAPIADQTPVNHQVDPDEEMAMPEMSDIDTLLAELGADVPLDEAPKSAASVAEQDQAPAPVSAPPAPMPEFEGILAQAQAAEAQKAAEEARAASAPPAREPLASLGEPAAASVRTDPAPPVPDPSVDELLDSLEDLTDEPVAESAAKAPSAPAAPDHGACVTITNGSAPEQAPAAKGAPLRVESPGPAGSAASKPSVAHHPEDGGEEDDIDLNELDALLDDILATAPEVPPSTPQAAPSNGPVIKTGPVVIPVPDQALMPADVSGEIAALTDRVRRLEERAGEALAARLQKLEESVTVLEESEISEAMMDGFINARVEAKIAELLEPGSAFMDALCNEIRGRFAEGAFDDNLEKMAAAAAAKVIREEISALMQENG